MGTLQARGQAGIIAQMLEEPYLNPTILIDEYVSGSALLMQAVAGMTPEQLVLRPIPGKWSTLEVICHIADFEIIYADRIKRVIAEDKPTLFNGEPGEFAARLAYHQRNLDEEIPLIVVIRRQVARILRTLRPEDFQRRGIHSTSGPVTLKNLLDLITNHIPHHLQFIQEKKRVLELAER